MPSRLLEPQVLRQHPISEVIGDVLLFCLSIVGLMWVSPILEDHNASFSMAAHKLLVAGFILVIGAFGGRVAHHMHLPHLTGYLITGVLIGPESPIAVCSLIKEVDHKHILFIQSLAIGLIALMAGAEIRMAWLRARFKGIVYALLWQTACVPIAIFAVIMLLWSSMPFAASAEAAHMPAWVIAALVGIIALANSPAVVISVIKETKSQGPLTEMSMGVSVFKDVIVILAFTLVLAVAITLGQAQEAAATASGASSAGMRIAEAGSVALLKILLSIVIGFIIGFALRVFTQKSAFRLPWILVAVAAIVAAGEPFGLKPLFCLLAAGFACENIGERTELGTHRLESSLARVAAPVFVLFFVSAGLKLHVHAVIESFGLIMILVVVRMLMLYVSVRAATKMSKLEPSVQRNLWAAMIPQAGVSLGLIIIIANQFPSWGGELQTLIIAAIAIHELVGPVIFALALKNAGETHE